MDEDAVKEAQEEFKRRMAEDGDDEEEVIDLDGSDPEEATPGN